MCGKKIVVDDFEYALVFLDATLDNSGKDFAKLARLWQGFARL
jgi:hypothetical protein